MITALTQQRRWLPRTRWTIQKTKKTYYKLVCAGVKLLVKLGFWVQKKFGSKKILGPKKFWVQKNFGSKKVLGQKKIWVNNQVWVHKILRPKKFESAKYSVSKSFGPPFLRHRVKYGGLNKQMGVKWGFHTYQILASYRAQNPLKRKARFKSPPPGEKG